MVEHHATIRVNAPVEQVYALFTHFNDYPKFMTYVKEVTFLDDQRSHWIADVAGTREWDAVNEDWIPNRQIGWRSTSGLANRGRVMFEDDGAAATRIDVDVSYDPPAGILGQIGEALGAGTTFEARLQHDLEHFARMVDEAPAGALDPSSSSYLFHAESAAATGRTTRAQDQTMGTSEPPLLDDTGAGLVADESLNDPGIPNVPGTTTRDIR